MHVASVGGEQQIGNFVEEGQHAALDWPVRVGKGTPPIPEQYLVAITVRDLVEHLPNDKLLATERAAGGHSVAGRVDPAGPHQGKHLRGRTERRLITDFKVQRIWYQWPG